jgi:hypothetical protein
LLQAHHHHSPFPCSASLLSCTEQSNSVGGKGVIAPCFSLKRHTRRPRLTRRSHCVRHAGAYETPNVDFWTYHLRPSPLFGNPPIHFHNHFLFFNFRLTPSDFCGLMSRFTHTADCLSPLPPFNPFRDSQSRPLTRNLQNVTWW